MEDLPAHETAMYMQAWLSKRIGGNRPGGAMEALAQPQQPDSEGLIESFDGDLRALTLEFAVRAVANLLGPNARIVMGKEVNGQ